MKRFCESLLIILAFSVAALAQKPVATLPNGITVVGGAYVGTVMDTTYSLPTGGTTWAAHDVTQFKAALTGSAPGDVIVLDAGVTYSGNFVLPKKTNPSHKWIYIISSNLAAMPEGVRVGPADASKMPKIVTPGYTTTFKAAWGANYWRLAGLEVTTASNYCPVTPCPSHNYLSGQLMAVDWAATYEVPDHIFIDRSYFHGDPTHNVGIGIQSNYTWGALIDSDVREIHAHGSESQATGSFNSTGPFKIVNNYLEAATENILFGGSGQNFNIGVASDIEIRNNYLFKPLSWVPLSVDQSLPNSLVVKNLMECKSCLRMLFDSNVAENNWAGGQVGYSLVLTVRSAQSGDMTVVTDITVTNNIFKNVVAWLNTLPVDDFCGVQPDGSNPYPNCHNPGSQDRWNITNNLVTLWNPAAPGWGGAVAGNVSFNPSYDRINHHPGAMKNVLFQHNTTIPFPGSNCPFGAYFNIGGQTSPPPGGLSQNIWLLDNVLCKQTTGSWGTGGTHTADYMGVPNTPPFDLNARHVGNVMLKTADSIATWPPNNIVVPSATFDVNGQLTSLDYSAHTTDGLQAGYSSTGIIPPPTYALSGIVTGPCAGNSTLALTGAATSSTTTDGSGNYSFHGLLNGAYMVTLTAAGCSVVPPSIAVTIASADSVGNNFVTSALAPPLYVISGTVTGVAVSGVAITVTGFGTASTLTNGSGNFTVPGLAPGSYTVTPSKGTFVFTPPSQAVTIVAADVTGVTFVSATAPSHSISGTIAGLGAGTILYLASSNQLTIATTLTGPGGTYTFPQIPSGTYSVMPASSCFAFTPIYRAVTVDTTDITGVDFAAH